MASGGLAVARAFAVGRVWLKAATCVAALLPLSAPARAEAAPRCSFADAPLDAVGVKRTTAALGCLVNYERGVAGLPTIAADDRLGLAARRHAVDMGRRAFFSDVAPAPAPHGATLGERLVAAEFPSAAESENIARSQPTARAVVREWLANRGTCQNVLARRFTHAGTGGAMIRGGPYWALVLARPPGTPADAGPDSACPRLPAVPAPSGKPSPLSITARRTGQTLAVSVTVPAELGRATLVVRVQQRGRTVRTLRRRIAPSTRQFSITLPETRAGRVVVRAGPLSNATETFR